MTYIKNLRAYIKAVKQSDWYWNIKGSAIQYHLIRFNFLTGKLIFMANDYGLFYIVERDAKDFI